MSEGIKSVKIIVELIPVYDSKTQVSLKCLLILFGNSSYILKNQILNIFSIPFYCQISGF